MTSCARPIDGTPISSQARPTPTRKQTTTRAAIVFTSPDPPGSAITPAPSIIWNTKVTASPTRNSASRTVPHWTGRSWISDSSEAATKASPTAATITAVTPILCPGISANSDTASALMNAVSAADARIRYSCAAALARLRRSADTEMATNSSPVRAPATPALARKKSWMLAGTTRRLSQLAGPAPDRAGLPGRYRIGR